MLYGTRSHAKVWTSHPLDLLTDAQVKELPEDFHLFYQVVAGRQLVISDYDGNIFEIADDPNLKIERDHSYDFTFNQRVYGQLVKCHVDNHHDFRFVCNRMGNLYRKIDDGTVDSVRICKGPDMTCDYLGLIGCCNEVDELIYNPATGNFFWIGFNNGH